MTVTPRDPRVVIIGSGIAGICAAVALQQAGFHEFTILERGSSTGICGSTPRWSARS